MEAALAYTDDEIADAPDTTERAREILCTVLQGPAPCDDCRHRQQCMERLEACHAFKLYVEKGGSEIRWGSAPRAPRSRDIYQAVFDENADDRKPGPPPKVSVTAEPAANGGAVLTQECA